MHTSCSAPVIVVSGEHRLRRSLKFAFKDASERIIGSSPEYDRLRKVAARLRMRPVAMFSGCICRSDCIMQSLQSIANIRAAFEGNVTIVFLQSGFDFYDGNEYVKAELKKAGVTCILDLDGRSRRTFMRIVRQCNG